MSWRSLWTAAVKALGVGADDGLPAERPRPPRRGAQEVRVGSGGRLVRISYRPSMLAEAEAMLAQEPTGLVKWWRLVVFEAVDEAGPVRATLELIDDARRVILRDQRLSAEG